MENVLVIRYGEVALKGQNRRLFEDALEKHIRLSLDDMPNIKVSRSYGRLFIKGVDEAEQAVERLRKVPGIVSINPAIQVPAVKENMVGPVIEQIGKVLDKYGDRQLTFRISTRRADKSFPMTSPELSSALGEDALQEYPDLRVDLRKPDIEITVEIRDGVAYISREDIRGMGGLPLGTLGKGLLLISGGIDSPVAGYLGIKRGVRMDALHFWSYPITGQPAKDKVVKLCSILNQYDPFLKLYIAPFTRIQTAIMEKCPERYRVIVMRRMMMRVACALCDKIGAHAIFTGENVGQVASQTLESLGAIQDAASLPVIRPLACFDKQDTVNLARELGTYETSCLPYEDCCTVFVPKHPVTKPKLKSVNYAESFLDIQELVDECVENITSESLQVGL